MPSVRVEIESRILYVNEAQDATAEVVDMVARCAYADDGLSPDNGFDLELRSDGQRHLQTIDYASNQQIINSLRSTAIAGTVSGVVFTRSAGTWTVNALNNWWAFCYDSTEDFWPEHGVWLPILQNLASTIIFPTAPPVGVDRVALVARDKFRHFVQVIPKAGFFGNHFQYKITKVVPPTGFSFYGCKISAVRINNDPEFSAGGGVAQNGWE